MAGTVTVRSLSTPDAGPAPVTDPDLLKALNAPQPVTDPDTLAQLNAAPDNPFIDAAKSFGSGLVKGATSIAGLPGDLATVLGNVISKAAQHFQPDVKPEERAKSEKEFWEKMLDPQNIAYVAASGGLPAAPPMTSSDVQGLVEKATGPLHEPQTTPGKFAQTVGEFVPAALAGPEGMAGNVAKLAVAPGLASEAAGEATKGSNIEGPARFVGALLGGLGGAAVGQGAQGVANYMAARQAASDIAPDANAAAVSRMAQSYAADRLNPQIVAARQAALGPEAMALDMGRQMQGRAEAIAAQPGQGQNTVLDAVEQRVHGTDQFGNVNSAFGQQTAQRIRDTLDANMGPAHNKVDLINGVSDIVDQYSKPLYDQVMAAHPVVDVPADITSRPAVAAAMKNATTLARQYGESLTSPAVPQTSLNAAGVPVTQMVSQPARTSLRYWDYVKKDLDRRINAYMKSGGASELNSADKADLGGLMDARNALRNHLDQVTNGAYAQARRAWAYKPDLTEAYEFGRSAFNNRLLPEEFSDELSHMSLPERALAQAGFRREIERVIDVARNDGAAARSMLDTNSNLAKIEALFGPRARTGVENRIAAETRFQDAANKIAANSRTQVRGQLAKDTESPSAATPPQANITGFLYKGLGQGMQYLRNQGMEGTRAAIGRMSTMSGADLQRLSEVLARYNAGRTASAGPPALSQAGALARVLAATPEAYAARP